ncbi:AraC family transcriptional regulator [Paenibacillus sp. FSL R7-0048]|jgi:AraC-like DNA-binding protein|uniref:AraC family transcriptional regulator n=1 Tax=Paenibacillus odorifer TaxID=189426 RepID=A0ABX3GZ02_9BACL|nr:MULTISPECIES: AraC family transcriptional regulator [Paenibacillus]MDH6427409.1 AraC-like DNA-binding protein [Paenibacillus sp. PastH-4]MDH6443439.1 AraC-like DNA-binding protein [Paenibacillus sp. PastF-4]MDH6525857.1 AraC-like DNA-binding protein [Paenibacillus sp. PastH-3]OMC80517.1 AraC family transcriptional regulator [Paenibacillus odorifer]OMD40969.1 AraC family transcriptional regulator [Paenibacillus odorifer]
MSKELLERKEELARLIEHHSSQDGVYETAIPSLFVIRNSNVTEPVYRVYKPSLCFIAQGTKEILLAKERFEYGPANYLISSMNLPVIGQIIKASPNAPYLSFKLEFTQSQILKVLNDSEFKLAPKENAKRAMYVGQIELPLLDAILRLVRLLDDPKDIPFLAPIYTDEILYRLLQGPYGVTLAQIAMEGSSTYRIREAIEQIIENCDKPLRIEELAETASMSISSFHRHFKEVTAMSPIQFQKHLRLQEARRLLLSESADAADVAFRVGYESASQFSREYSRMFGSPPRADIKRLKEDMLIG